MPEATIYRRATAHTEAALANGSPSASITRENTGRATARLSTEEQGVP